MLIRKNLLFQIIFGKSKRFFVYLVQDNLTMARVCSEAIKWNLHYFPNDIHIVLPVYGIYIFNSTESRFPRRLKKLHLFFLYLKDEVALKKKLKSQLSHFLEDKIISKCTLPSTIYWILCIIVSGLIGKKFYSPSAGNSKNQDFTINGQRINISREVIDTYIRFKPSPLFVPDDIFVYNIYKRAFALILYYNAILSNKSTYLFCSYASYIQNGIPAKLIYRNRQNLITLGSSRCLYRIHDTKNTEPLISAHPDHTQFNLSSCNKRELTALDIKEAEDILIKRLEQRYDASMTYMEQNNSLEPALTKVVSPMILTNEGAIFLMLHAFNDSVHVYRWFLFTDFWEWATETIEYCISSNQILYIKPHPNLDPISIEAINRLKSKYNTHTNIKWLTSDFKNSTIFSSNPALIITGYGSVAIEAAFSGIKVLVAGDFPGEKMNIAMSPKSKAEYFHFLHQPSSIDPLTLRKNAILTLAFLRHFEGHPQLMSRFLKSREELNDVELLNSDEINNYLGFTFSELSKKIQAL